MAWHTNHNILIQGIHRPLAQAYLPKMLAYGSHIVAGVSAGEGGVSNHGLPIFDLVKEAWDKFGTINTSLIFVDPFEVMDAAFEAIAAGIQQLIIITAGVPPFDMVRLLRQAQLKNVQILGPGSSGLVIPGKLWLGTNFVQNFHPGPIALLSRDSSLSQEVAILLNQARLGQSFVIDVGGCDLPGSDFRHWLSTLDHDPNTQAIALLGRYGSQTEIDLIPFIRDRITTPVVTFLCGGYVPVQYDSYNVGSIIANRLFYAIGDAYTPTEIYATFKAEKLAFGRTPKELINLLKRALNPPRRRARRSANPPQTS